MPGVQPSHLPGHPLHVIQRARLRAVCFFCERDRLAYLHWLARYAGRLGCALHAYVLMGNHVHLLLTPSRADSVTRMMSSLAERYARYIGETYEPEAPRAAARSGMRTSRPRPFMSGSTCSPACATSS